MKKESEAVPSRGDGKGSCSQMKSATGGALYGASSPSRRRADPTVDACEMRDARQNPSLSPMATSRHRMVPHPQRIHCSSNPAGRRLCTTTSSAPAGELATVSASQEAAREDDLAEESHSCLVRDTCRLLELRDSWSPKPEAQLRHLLRVLSPPQVWAMLRAQAQADVCHAFEFFWWADLQWRYRHAPEVFDEMLGLLSRTRLHDPARRVMRLMIRRGVQRGPRQFTHLMLSYSRAGKLRSAMRVGSSEGRVRA